MSQLFSQWCFDLSAWIRAHHGAAPRRKSEDAEEKRLANWVAKTLQRKTRSPGERPSDKQLTPEEISMLDAALAPGFFSEEEAAADAFTPGLRREEESVADVEIKSLRANSLASEDPGLRQEETVADAFTPGLRHEEVSGAMVVDDSPIKKLAPSWRDEACRHQFCCASAHRVRMWGFEHRCAVRASRIAHLVIRRNSLQKKKINAFKNGECISDPAPWLNV